MGCIEDREAPSAEEVILQSQESLLDFQKQSSAELDLTIRKYSSGDLITIPQLVHILNSLQLPNPRCDNKSVKQFYRSLQRDGCYERRHLIVLAILFGQGTAAEKAELLFEAFDDDASRMLEVQEFEVMWQCVVDNAIVHLPALVPSSTEAMTGYLARLQQASKSAKLHFLDDLFDKTRAPITLHLFRYKLLNTKLKCFLSPSAFRRRLETFYEYVPVKPPMRLGRKRIDSDVTEKADWKPQIPQQIST